MIVVLTGGTGGAKFLQGVAQVVAPQEITAVVNTGDDLAWWGLHVSPDIDSVLYGMAGLLSRERGWGLEGETFACLERMRQLGAPAWFQLGDRDLATHLRRTELLRSGRSLSETTKELAAALGVKSRVLPMSDDRVETRVATVAGELAFQEYFVRERWAIAATGVRFVGAEKARPAPGVVEAIASADAVLIAPSNPITSVGPILAIPGMHEALRAAAAAKVAVSPIVAGKAVSGPAAQLMHCQGFEASAAGVARLYADFLTTLVIDESDCTSTARVEAAGVRCVCAPTLMDSDAAKARLARVAVDTALAARAQAAR